jgi:AraC-like DNA-binding protein
LTVTATGGAREKMAIRFTTDDVHPRDRLSSWRETMSLVPHDFSSESGPNFFGEVTSDFLDDVLISEFRCDPCEVERSARHIARSDNDDFLLCSQQSGRAIYTQDGREAVAENGGVVLIDPRRPFSVRYEGQTLSVALQIPRRVLDARFGSAAGLTAHALDVGEPLAGLASGFLSMLPSRVGAVDATLRAKLAAQVLDLLELAFAARVGQMPTTSARRMANLLRLKAVIEERLSDPTLRPQSAAEATGISVRYANDLLSSEGFSTERYIIHRRLARCRKALEDAGHNGRLISEIAFDCGFSDLSHFVRRFRDAFGLTPGDCRRRAQQRLREARDTGAQSPNAGMLQT